MSPIRALALLAVATWAVASTAPATAAPGDYVGTQPPAASPPAPPPYAGVPLPGAGAPPGQAPYAGIPPASSYVGVPPMASALSGAVDRPGGTRRAGAEDDGEEVAASSSVPMTAGDAAGLAALAAFATGVVLTLRKRA
jgi:hypothetical protein